ncbi:hypothetical protein O3M35_009573 [Rhynocoris fuscipes]|uniref:Uncharacterized protein n=1 Tax=Rhynocoris fuscipes TaxID=488301 RepID=A0AAW1D4W2_9HEMI
MKEKKDSADVKKIDRNELLKKLAEVRLPQKEYSMLDVFVYPYMAAGIKYIIRSYETINELSTDTDGIIEDALNCRSDPCKCSDNNEQTSTIIQSKEDNKTTLKDVLTSKTKCCNKCRRDEMQDLPEYKEWKEEKYKTGKKDKVKTRFFEECVLQDGTEVDDEVVEYIENMCSLLLQRIGYDKFINQTDSMPMWLLNKSLRIEFMNGTIYAGHFESMIFNGFGILRYKNGEVYKGEIKDGKAHGFGRLFRKNNSFYIGDMSYNKQNGYGMDIYYQWVEEEVDEKGNNEEKQQENKETIKENNEESEEKKELKGIAKEGGGCKCNVEEGSNIIEKDRNNKTVTKPRIIMAHFGKWKEGLKEEEGVTVFGEKNWYEGRWHNGLMEGFGVRRYQDGTLYAGYWKNGARHGEGVLLWPNNDIYNGEWKNGLMDGNGSYIWKSYQVLDWLTSPSQNCFVGKWRKGQRHGIGTLYLANGVKLIAEWKKGIKDGYGELVTTNGTIFYCDKFFVDDSIAESMIPIMSEEEKANIKQNENNINKIILGQKEEGESTLTCKPEHVPGEVKGFVPEFLPICAPFYTMDYTWHIYKLFVPDQCVEIYTDISGFVNWFPRETVKRIFSVETDWLQKVLIKRSPELYYAYYRYATGGCSSSGRYQYRPVLMRMSLWKMLRDCGLFLTQKSLRDLDKEVGIGSNPFDQIAMYEMVNYLLILSWEVYVKKDLFNPNIPGLIASAFDRFIHEILVCMAHKYVGNILMFFKYIPLNGLYSLFKSFKHPVTIETVVQTICPTDEKFRDILPRPNKFIRKLAKGLNIINPDGYVEYFPHHHPYFDKIRKKKESVVEEAADIRLLGLLGLEPLIQIIMEVLPNAMIKEGSIKPDYEITFLDFCDILCELIVVYLNTVIGHDDPSTTELEELGGKEELVTESPPEDISYTDSLEHIVKDLPYSKILEKKEDNGEMDDDEESKINVDADESEKEEEEEVEEEEDVEGEGEEEGDSCGHCSCASSSSSSKPNRKPSSTSSSNDAKNRIRKILGSDEDLPSDFDEIEEESSESCEIKKLNKKRYYKMTLDESSDESDEESVIDTEKLNKMADKLEIYHIKKLLGEPVPEEPFLTDSSPCSEVYYTGEEDELMRDLIFKDEWEVEEEEEKLDIDDDIDEEDQREDDEDEEEEEEEEEVEEEEDNEEDEDEVNKYFEILNLDEEQFNKRLLMKYAFINEDKEETQKLIDYLNELIPTFPFVVDDKLLLSKDKDYTNLPATSIVDRLLRLCHIAEVIVKHGLFLEDVNKFMYIEDKEENDFLNSIFHQEFKDKKKEEVNEKPDLSNLLPPQEENSDSDESSNVFIRDQLYYQFSDSTMTSTEYDDECSSSESTNELKKLLFKDEENHPSTPPLSPVSTNSTFSTKSFSIVTSSDTSASLDTSMTDDLSSEYNLAGTTSSISITASNRSDESSIPFTGIALEEPSESNVSQDKPTIVFYRKRRNEKGETEDDEDEDIDEDKEDYDDQYDEDNEENDNLTKILTNAIFGDSKDTRRLQFLISELEGQEFLKVKKRSGKKNLNIRDDVLLKRETMTDDIEMPESIKLLESIIKSRKDSDFSDVSSEKTTYNMSTTSTEDGKSSTTSTKKLEKNIKNFKTEFKKEEEEQPYEYDFDSYMNLFQNEEPLFIDYQYFFDLPKIKHPLMIRDPEFTEEKRQENLF